MPFSIPSERLIQPAFALLKAGDILNGIHELYKAWSCGSYQAMLIFSNKSSLDKTRFQQITPELLVPKDELNHNFKIGLAYFTGIGVTQSYLQAAPLFIDLHDSGFVAATLMLGRMYALDLINREQSQRTRDIKAVELFQDAAMAGNTIAQINLGSMYVEGRAGTGLSQVLRDIEASKWYTKAALTGNTIAKTNLGFLYQQNRAGFELTRLERDNEIIKLLKQAVECGDVDAAWNLACHYKTSSSSKLALKFFSVAAFLYEKDDLKSIQEISHEIRSYSVSSTRNYANARVQVCLDDNISPLLSALNAFSLPSEYALFFDQDLNIFGNDSQFCNNLFNKLSAFAKNASQLSYDEKLALVLLIIQYIAYQVDVKRFNDDFLAKNKVDSIKPYLQILFTHKLHPLLSLLQASEVEDTFTNLCSNILATVMAGPALNRDLVSYFVKLIVNLPNDTGFWQDKNLIKLLCAYFTQGHYILMTVNKSLSIHQVKALLEHIIQNDDSAAIDDLGLLLMSRYGISLIDQESLQAQVQAIMDKFTTKSASTMPLLQSLHQSTAPPLNPILAKLYNIIIATKSHESLIHLLSLRERLANSPEDKHHDLVMNVNKLLDNFGIKSFNHQKIELDCSVSAGNCLNR